MYKNNFVNDPYLVYMGGLFNKSFCESLISEFEHLEQNNLSDIMDKSICETPTKGHTCNNCHCLRVDLMQHSIFKEEIPIITFYLEQAVAQYKQLAQIADKQFPKKYNYENLKIKKYKPNSNDHMDLHIDVFDKASTERFLAFIVYLNDDFEGGHTVFPRHNKSFKPVAGSVVVFPPMWPWIHSAEPVTSGRPKYFLGSYLRYV